MSVGTKTDLAIVSCYGRGHWLAAEAIDHGLSVTLIDVTNKLGRWAPEDIEGPFGLLNSPMLKQSQLARLDAETHADSIDEGFTFLLPSGPLDLRGAHSKYLLEQLLIPAAVQEYVLENEKLNEKRRAELQKEISELPFTRKWLAAFAHFLASPVDLPNFDTIDKNPPLPLSAPCSIRRVSRRGVEKSLQWLKDRGVKLHEDAKLVDMAMDGNTLKHIEIESEWSGVVEAERFIWTLSSAETAIANKSMSFELYASKVLRPSWVWMRYRYELVGDAIETLPQKFWLVHDLAQSWTHANLLGLQRTTSPNLFDVWALLPENHRFQKNYMDEIHVKMKDVLLSHIPAIEIKSVEMPQEYRYDDSNLGPACFAKFATKELRALNPKNFKNMNYDSPELWQRLDWTGQFQHQNQIFAELMNWRDEREKRRQKDALKEQNQSAAP